LECLKAGESSGKLPLRTCLECSVPEPYRSPEWALVPAKTGLKRLNANDDDEVPEFPYFGTVDVHALFLHTKSVSF
jgi:hypothetical protein